METTAKELVRRLFSLQTVSRLPVLPFISCWSAKVGQVSVREMWADPSLLVHSLLQAHQVAGSDWVAGPLDITLEAEAGGCRLEWGRRGRRRRWYPIHGRDFRLFRATGIYS